MSKKHKSKSKTKMPAKGKNAVPLLIGGMAVVIIVGSIAAFSGIGFDPVSLLASVFSTAPSVKLTASAPSIYPGGSVNITWSSTNALTCTSGYFSTGGAIIGTVTVHPTQTTRYYLQCNAAPYTVVKSVLVTVNATTQLTASIFSDVPSVVAGGTAHVTWTSNNATSCTSPNFSTGGATSGTVAVRPLVAKSYTLTCTGSSSSVTQSTDIGILAHPAPVVTLSTDGTNGITSGGTAHITWSSQNATSCTSADFTTGGATSGTVAVHPTVQTNYGLTCTGAGGTASAPPVMVNILAAQPPSVVFTSDVKSVPSGGTVHLTWSSQRAVACSSGSFSTGGATSGTVAVNPTVTTNYYLSCNAAHTYTVVKNVIVTVTP
jgi:hypothetical protein